MIVIVISNNAGGTLWWLHTLETLVANKLVPETSTDFLHRKFDASLCKFVVYQIFSKHSCVVWCKKLAQLYVFWYTRFWRLVCHQLTMQ